MREEFAHAYSQLQGTTQCSYVFDQRLRCVGCTACLFCLFVSSELQIKKESSSTDSECL